MSKMFFWPGCSRSLLSTTQFVNVSSWRKPLCTKQVWGDACFNSESSVLSLLSTTAINHVDECFFIIGLSFLISMFNIDLEISLVRWRFHTTVSFFESGYVVTVCKCKGIIINICAVGGLKTHRLQRMSAQRQWTCSRSKCPKMGQR